MLVIIHCTVYALCSKLETEASPLFNKDLTLTQRRLGGSDIDTELQDEIYLNTNFKNYFDKVGALQNENGSILQLQYDK